MDKNSEEYQAGIRDGKISSLEKSVRELTNDINRLKVAMYMLYGAIALVQFLPEVRGLFPNGGG